VSLSSIPALYIAEVRQVPGSWPLARFTVSHDPGAGPHVTRFGAIRKRHSRQQHIAFKGTSQRTAIAGFLVDEQQAVILWKMYHLAKSLYLLATSKEGE
jgi:hypothetical protein